MPRTVSAKNRFLWLGLLISCIAFMHAVTAFAGTITCVWDAPTTNSDGTLLPDLVGYKIYYGPTSDSYTNALDVGNVTTSVVDNLTDGLTYYFAVTAYNSAGVESSFSNEVSKTLPPPQVTLTTFMITATAGIGGTITPAGTSGVNYGATQTFTIIPSAGYHVATVLVDGVSKGAVTTYTFTSVTANHTIAASFAINTYTITASAGTGGAISPSGALSANYGGSAIFSITPKTGYSTADVKVDGVSKGAVTTYTFTNVTVSHTIAATFAQKPPSTIMASAGPNGSISPTGAVSVPSGNGQTFTITPVAGYHVANVLVDGASAGAITTYTFTNVTANHTIAASYTINASAGSSTPTGVTITSTPVIGYGVTANYTLWGGTPPYTVQVKWGDGRSETATGVAAGANFLSHAYANSGTYTVTITAMDAGVNGIVTTNSKNTSVTIAPSTSTVSGKVTRVGGITAVPTASITLKLNGIAKKLVYTDTSGNFTMTGVAPGAYTATVAKSGLTFANPAANITVISSNVTGVKISSTN